MWCTPSIPALIGRQISVRSKSAPSLHNVFQDSSSYVERIRIKKKTKTKKQRNKTRFKKKHKADEMAQQLRTLAGQAWTWVYMDGSM